MEKSVYLFLWNVIKPYKWYYLLMLIAPVGGAFYELVCNYSLKLVIDRFSSADTFFYGDFLYPISLFVSVQILHSALWRISNLAEWASEPYVRRKIILQSYDYVQHHSYKFFQENYAGSIISKLKGVYDGYDNFWANIHHQLAPSLASTVVLTLAIAIVSFKLFVFVTVWCVIFFIVIYKMSVKLDRISFEMTESKHKMFGMISDNITNIFSLFSFAGRKFEYSKIDKFQVEDNIPKQIRTYKYDFRIALVADFLYCIMLIAVFLFIIFLRKQDQITNGDLVFVMCSTLAMSWNLWKLIMNMQDFIKHMGDFKSSHEILIQSQNIIDKSDAVVLDIRDTSIEFKNVTFIYDSGTKVFDNLSLRVKNGEKIGIVGLSGAGKSTLVSVLLKYFQTNSGKISIGSQDIADVTSDSLRASVSLIPQDIMLFHRSILDNIRYGKPSSNDEEIIEAAKRANIHNFILSLKDGYHTMVGERGVKLSGGQRQRIAIARAVLKNAPILILDEATSSLDTETEQLIQASINNMLEDVGTTVIAIAHRLSTLKHLDRIIVLEKGKIIEEGRHEDLISMTDSLYKKLWEMQKI